MDAWVSPDDREDPDLRDRPFVRDSVTVEGHEQPVSLDTLENNLNVYHYFVGVAPEMEARDLIALINDPDAERTPFYTRFATWITTGNSQVYRQWYDDGAHAAGLAYAELEGHAYADAPWTALDAEDRKALVQWALDHPDAGAKLDPEPQDAYNRLIDGHRSQATPDAPNIDG